MRLRSLAFVALLALPSWSSAQRIPLPTIRRRGTPPPATLPPQPGIIANQLAYRRSKWSFESAPVVTHMEVPGATGGTTVFTTLGTANHADYRIGDHYAATMDVTGSTDFSSAYYLLTEVGGRYRPRGLEGSVRPYFDLRGGYTYMIQGFTTAVAPNGDVVADNPFASGWRYARGVGAAAGTGFEYSLTPSLALTTEFTAMRSRMNDYHITGPAAIPANENRYWMTSLRYMIGFKYNAVRLYRTLRQATP